MLKVYIGYDPVESVAYHTLCHSIISQSTQPVSISPIYTGLLKQDYTRGRDPKQSNDFSFSRFLVPYLNNYEGFALFMDCDMLLRGDISELFELGRLDKSVMVVKHDYTPKDTLKYLGNTQHKYEKKNWSSVMLFNCNHCHTKRLTPDYVNNASGLELHQFKWTDENRIGELPKAWNWLVGEYPYNKDAMNVHYTVGGPYFKEYQNCDYSDEWFKSSKEMNHCEQIEIPSVKVSSK